MSESLLEQLRQKPLDGSTIVTGKISSNGKMIIVGEPEYGRVGFVSVHRRATVNSPWERLFYHYGKEDGSELGKVVGMDKTGANLAFYVPGSNMVYIQRTVITKPIVQPLKNDPIYGISTIGYVISDIVFSGNGDTLVLKTDRGLVFSYEFDIDEGGYIAREIGLMA